MTIHVATSVHLADQGIIIVSGVVDFDKDSLQQIVLNCCRPGGRIEDPDPGQKKSSDPDNTVCV